MSSLEYLEKTGTIVVADTGEFQKIKAFNPLDCTTNPSLINAAARLPEYRHLVDEAVEYARANAEGTARVELCVDKLFTLFGRELAALVKGYVSIEVDARLSFDVQKTVDRAHRIIKLAADVGLPKERILIKLATTWEGCEAARILEAEGISCNMTLMFALCQAQAAAAANATLISAFVGRILDWHKKAHNKEFAHAEDPGVLSLKSIYQYFKDHGIKTIVMGASFRNVGEIIELAGCDRLTISPALLEELSKMTDPVPVKLQAPEVPPKAGQFVPLTEAEFRLALNNDACATEKLAEGIRGFSADLEKLEAFLKPLLDA